MNWSSLYDGGNEPTLEDIERYIGNGALLWRDLRTSIEADYDTKPKLSYSKCAAQPGWNVKYQKSGKSLCTLYPEESGFISLVVVGAKEEEEMPMLLPHLTDYTKALYERTRFVCGGRWLMIKVSSEEILEDVKRLISIRVPKKKTGGADRK